MTSDYPQIDFYDISCLTTEESWSPFTARTYVALRLLDIPFQRHLVPMARINSTLTSLGAPPPKSERHTLPAITITSSGKKEWITDSSDIAEKLQDLYLSSNHPLSTSLFPDPHSRSCVELVRECFKSSLYTADHRWKSVNPAIYKILEPESSEYYITDRTVQWGKHPQEILDTDAAANEARDGGVNQVYAKIIQPFAQLYDDKEKEGVWLGGERPIYADVMTLALLQWLKCANQDAFEQGLSINGGVLQKAWMEGQPLLKC
ncbi:hypothetical protein PHSY_000634 [Pseudozyma hubeiensis SY62]|uniref:Uncharacterized protein n=1 Tax=Pseudozyma hubeiensis (strain SY62) TaxID=1305764 RepID=R9NWS1_PSEHS|nr:hypothetical protein PHSY_000634 [Pseudozyma hubeiensis SY62]GAC93073.1 hypothetical protein PHSY_000634 [Pseudozyma hubeiensis SY62]